MLKPSQEKVLQAIALAMRKYGIIPTMQEVAGATGLSLGGVQKQIYALERLG
jgi:hypothetical protein